MKITYKTNPLDTTVELDDHEKQILWYKIKCDELIELLFDAHFHMKEGQFYDLEKAKKSLDPDYFLNEEDDSKSPLEKRCDQMLEYYLEELKSYHIGDCTCVPASCGKCHAEDKLGINTIPGLGKHSAYKVDNALREANGDIIAALESLKNYNPVINDAYKGKEDLWHQHLPRWKKEAKGAYEWLLKYKNEKLV